MPLDSLYEGRVVSGVKVVGERPPRGYRIGANTDAALGNIHAGLSVVRFVLREDPLLGTQIVVQYARGQGEPVVKEHVLPASLTLLDLDAADSSKPAYVPPDVPRPASMDRDPIVPRPDVERVAYCKKCDKCMWTWEYGNGAETCSNCGEVVDITRRADISPEFEDKVEAKPAGWQ